MKKTIAGLSLLTLVALCGCSDSNDAAVLTGPSAPLDAGDVNAFVQDILLPGLEMVDPSLWEPLTTRTSVHAASGAPLRECEDVPGFCDSGTLEACPGDVGTLVFRFQSCSLGGDELNGSVTVIQNSDTSQSFSFNLSVAGASMTGSFSLNQAGDCIVETIDQLGIAFGGSSSFMNGTLEYCPGVDWPDGDAAWSVIIANVGSYFYQVACDGTSSAGLIIRDVLAGDAIMLICTADLETGTATCQFID